MVISLAQEGLGQTVRLCCLRLSEFYHEKRLGIKTSGRINLEEFGIREQECHYYSPTEYRSFAKVMKFVSVRADRDCFIDYRSGLGRVVVLAARHPFRTVFGVEISPELNAAAKENLRRARKKLRCKDIRLIVSNASLFDLPDEVTHIHFYNPFSRNVLLDVLKKIRESLERAPRRLTILYKHPVHLEELIGEYDWMKKRHELKLRHRYAIYEVSA